MPEYLHAMRKNWDTLRFPRFWVVPSVLGSHRVPRVMGTAGIRQKQPLDLGGCSSMLRPVTLISLSFERNTQWLA